MRELMNDPFKLATLSPRELDLLLGEFELSISAGSKLASDTEKAELGRSYFSEALPQIRLAICGNTMVEALFAKEHKDRSEVIVGVSALLVGFSPVSPLLAAKLLHYGYSQLCPSEEKS